MSDEFEVANPKTVSVFRGKIARRNFIRTSGRLAVAAPAVVLLMSAGSGSALAQAAPLRTQTETALSPVEW